MDDGKVRNLECEHWDKELDKCTALDKGIHCMAKCSDGWKEV